MATILVVTLAASGDDDDDQTDAGDHGCKGHAVIVNRYHALRHASVFFAKVCKCSKGLPNPRTRNGQTCRKLQAPQPLAAEKHPSAGQRLGFHKTGQRSP